MHFNSFMQEVNEYRAEKKKLVTNLVLKEIERREKTSSLGDLVGNVIWLETEKNLLIRTSREWPFCSLQTTLCASRITEKFLKIILQVY